MTADTTRIELAAHFDLRHLSDAFYPIRIRRSTRCASFEPVKRMPDGSVLLTRYADVNRGLQDPKTFSSDKHEEFGPNTGWMRRCSSQPTTSLVVQRSPLHTRVRSPDRRAADAQAHRRDGRRPGRLVDGLLDAMQPRAERADGRSDRVVRRGDSGRDQRQLLGVPHEGRPAAGLVARDPRCARTCAQAPDACTRKRGGARLLVYLEGLVARRAAALEIRRSTC